MPSTAARGPVPLLVLFHGAGGSADGVLRLVRADAVSTRAAILATNAASATWDALTPEPRTVLDMFDVFGDRRLSGFGPDAACLQSALTQVFRDVAIDAGKIAIGGFSDGATYALSLGLSNGELFRRIVAFAPGFILDGDRHGQPEVFISHGRRDAVLPIQRTSRRIVQTLRQHGYSVIVREFDGGHEVPAHIAREALEWAIG